MRTAWWRDGRTDSSPDTGWQAGTCSASATSCVAGSSVIPPPGRSCSRLAAKEVEVFGSSCECGGHIATLRRLVSLLALAVALSAGPAVAQAPLRLSLGEALALAAQHNPTAEAARWERMAREADALGASAAFLPTISAELGAMRTDDPVAAFGTKLRQGRFAQSDFALTALNFPSPINDVSTSLTLEQPILQLEDLFGRRAARAGARAGRLAEVRAVQAAAFEV